MMVSGDEIPVVRNKGRYDGWAMAAKAAGYPLCKLCREPIARKYWGRRDLCSPCYSREQHIDPVSSLLAGASIDNRYPSERGVAYAWDYIHEMIGND